jgi:hypothetical protein
MEVERYAFLTSALEGGEWSASRLGPLYPRYPLDRRLGGPQSRSGHGGEEKNSQPPPGIEPPNPDHPVRNVKQIENISFCHIS